MHGTIVLRVHMAIHRVPLEIRHAPSVHDGRSLLRRGGFHFRLTPTQLPLSIRDLRLPIHDITNHVHRLRLSRRGRFLRHHLRDVRNPRRNHGYRLRARLRVNHRVRRLVFLELLHHDSRQHHRRRIRLLRQRQRQKRNPPRRDARGV